MREDRLIQTAGVSLQSECLLAGQRIEDLGRTIPAGGDNPVAARRECDRVDQVRMRLDAPEFLARDDVPPMEPPRGIDRGELRAVRRECDLYCLAGECRGLILLCATVDQTWAPAFAGETVVMDKFSARCAA